MFHFWPQHSAVNTNWEEEMVRITLPPLLLLHSVLSFRNQTSLVFKISHKNKSGTLKDQSLRCKYSFRKKKKSKVCWKLSRFDQILSNISTSWEERLLRDSELILHICPQILEPWQQTVCLFFFLQVFGMTRRPLPEVLSVQVGFCGNDGLEMEQKHKQLEKSSVKSENQIFFLTQHKYNCFYLFKRKKSIITNKTCGGGRGRQLKACRTEPQLQFSPFSVSAISSHWPNGNFPSPNGGKRPELETLRTQSKQWTHNPLKCMLEMNTHTRTHFKQRTF